MRTGILQLPEGNGTFLFSKICRETGNIYSLVFLGIMKQAGVLGNKFAFLEKVIHPNDSDENTQELFSYHLKASSLQQTLTELLLCAMDCSRVVVVVQLLNHVRLFVTPWTVACQASLSFTISQSLLKLMSIESVMPSNHLVLCRPLLLLPSMFPSIRVFSNESVLHIRWPKYCNFSFSISASNEYSGLISYRIDCFDPGQPSPCFILACFCLSPIQPACVPCYLHFAACLGPVLTKV